MPKKVTTFNIDSDILDATETERKERKTKPIRLCGGCNFNHNKMVSTFGEHDNKGGAIPTKQISETPVLKCSNEKGSPYRCKSNRNS